MPPHAFISTYAPRLRTYANSLLTPAVPPATTQNAPTSRITKRGTTAINYAEDGYDDDEFDEGDGPRRPTGLRSLRRDAPSQDKVPTTDWAGKELTAPVEVQGIWRDYMTKPKLGKTERQLHAQAILPLTLIPIRIELDIPSFIPAPAFPTPTNAHDLGIDPSLPAYKAPELTSPYRLRDFFMWNLHEMLITPDQFAMQMVNDLDLPNPVATAMQISGQIRQQLEEYAGVALHPLFDSTQDTSASGAATGKTVPPTTTTTTTTPAAMTVRSSRRKSATPATTSTPTPMLRGASRASGHVSPAADGDKVTASATPVSVSAANEHDPDDAYRCIITLNISLRDKLYTDKFEWSLLHPPGMAEKFAKVTCADLSLPGEWVSAITHGIYEAVLRLKKEACESGGLVGGSGIDNMAADGKEAGWRFDPEHLGAEWAPRVEVLSKEEIEKREGDRERQLRRLRRETARFSSSTGLTGAGVPQLSNSLDLQDTSETPLGRGERARKRRRFRSLSPRGGRANTPGNRGTPDVSAGASGGIAGYGGGGGSLLDWERQTWRCAHCMVWGSNVWAVRDGPDGPRSLCNNCGFLYEQQKKLPTWAKDLHRNNAPLGKS